MKLKVASKNLKTQRAHNREQGRILIGLSVTLNAQITELSMKLEVASKNLETLSLSLLKLR